MAAPRNLAAVLMCESAKQERETARASERGRETGREGGREREGERICALACHKAESGVCVCVCVCFFSKSFNHTF